MDMNWTTYNQQLNAYLRNNPQATAAEIEQFAKELAQRLGL
jgi:hypothetical protein